MKALSPLIPWSLKQEPVSYCCLNVRQIKDCFAIALMLCMLIESFILFSNRVKSDLLVMLALLVLLVQEERLDFLVPAVPLALQ